MPYREAPYAGRCVHCLRATREACTACAHPVCIECRERHDAEFVHKDYEG